MKSAKEMFEQLGYIKRKVYDEINDRVLDWNYTYIKYDGDKFKEIHINDETKLISISDQFVSQIVNQYNIPMLTFEELQAINKQVEELGWK